LHYGLLTYDTQNIGDDIQSLAVLQMLPQLDLFINRDHIGRPLEPHWDHVRMIINGWFMHSPALWPPAPGIETWITSFHISSYADRGMRNSPVEMRNSPAEIILGDANLNYLRSHAPIGARDLWTLKLLHDAGVDAYFSGCMTLTMGRPNIARDDGLLVLADVPREARAVILKHTEKDVVELTHVTSRTHTPMQRLRQAEGLLNVYARASCVVTSRLHCALPCLAFGTPVLFLIGAETKEPRLTASDIRVRSSGLKDMLISCATDAFVSGEFVYDVDNPPSNPGKHLGIASSLEQSARSFLHSGSHPLREQNWGPDLDTN
jgi:hypothetical protein